MIAYVAAPDGSASHETAAFADVTPCGWLSAQDQFRWGYDDDETTERDAVSSATAGRRERQRRPKGSAVTTMLEGRRRIRRVRLRAASPKPKRDGKLARPVTAQTHALPEEERAEVGKKYRDPEELFLALQAGNATLILRASWVMKQRGGRLPKRGDKLPRRGQITVAELREHPPGVQVQGPGALPVTIALSHFRRTKEHA